MSSRQRVGVEGYARPNSGERELAELLDRHAGNLSEILNRKIAIRNASRRTALALTGFIYISGGLWFAYGHVTESRDLIGWAVVGMGLLSVLFAVNGQIPLLGVLAPYGPRTVSRYDRELLIASQMAGALRQLISFGTEYRDRAMDPEDFLSQIDLGLSIARAEAVLKSFEEVFGTGAARSEQIPFAVSKRSGTGPNRKEAAEITGDGGADADAGRRKRPRRPADATFE